MAKILLVEDDNNLREIYEARLQAEGFTIVAAEDGEAALVKAKQERPDLIIADVMMPRISGFEMLDILRNTEGLKDTKVIMLTALGQADDKTRAESLGADRYLVKSQVTLEDIVKAAEELLGVNPDEPEAAPVAVDAGPGSAETASVQTTPMTMAQPPAEPATAAQPTPASTSTETEAAPVAAQELQPTPVAAMPLAQPPVATPTPTINQPSADTPATDAVAVAAPVTADPVTIPTAQPAPTPATTPATAPEPQTVPAPASDTTPTATPAPDAAPAVAATPAEAPTTITQPPAVADEPAVPVAPEPPAEPAAATTAPEAVETPVEPSEPESPATEKASDKTANANPVEPTSTTDQLLADAVKNLTSSLDKETPEATLTAPEAPSEKAVDEDKPQTAPEVPASPAVADEPAVPVAPAASEAVEGAVPTADEQAQMKAQIEAFIQQQGQPAAPQQASSAEPTTPEPPAQPAPVAPEPPAQPAPEQPQIPPANSADNGDDDSDDVSIAHKKIIQPVKPIATQPDLSELLAKEGIESLDETHPYGQPAAPGTATQPHQPGHVISPQAGTASTAAPATTAQADDAADPNSIAL